MRGFRYAPEVAAAFPSVVGGVIHAMGVEAVPAAPALAAEYAAEQVAALARWRSGPLSEIPSLAAWRRAFRTFDVDPTAYRSAAEALLRRLTKQGSIPSIHTLVDLGNLVAIRYALPVAVMDQRLMAGGTTVRFASGSERFTNLGSGSIERPDPGEVIFVDEAGLVVARRWCWRQSAASASREGTSEALITVEAHHDSARADIDAALADLETLLREHATPGALERGVVTAMAPVFESSLG